ncbi:DUF5602 domain-containing protein [Oscillatoria sp. FACHB-1407]|nr:DUF5602 domain-containing protein [Oscillatoria sp. FACHB-1407]
MFESDPQPLGEGTVRTYVKLDAQNQLQEVGVILTEAALADLPDDATEYVLQLPPQATGIAFTHVGLDWRSHGHPPAPIYGSPHFDVHFYTLTPEEREQITATGSDLEKAYLAPASDLIPAGYVLAPDSAEPRMGAHWIDPTSEEFQGTPHGFSHTLIYGFYNGEMAFLEPMITLDFLKSQQEFEGTFAVPTQYSKEGLYPSAYNITYNEATQEHTVGLTGFTQP